jgi:hypothetical protein
VLAPEIGEIIGGSQREERLEILDTRIAEHGIDREHYAPTVPSPASGRALRGTELDCMAGVALNQIMPADTSPSPPFRGEREGPDPQGWEGEGGCATNRLVGPPHPTLSPRPAGGEGKGRVVRATIRQQIFEQPVLTLSPDIPAHCWRG